MKKITLSLFASISLFTQAQNFTLVTDPNNPIVSEPASSGTFFGTTWTDINNDNRLDLFYAGTFFINQGNGNFSASANGIPNAGPTQLHSCSWADYENDGDLDLIYSRFIQNASSFETRIYKNDGAGQFSEHNTILNSINSTTWSVQWADFNNDSYVDFILTFADGFLGPNSFPNRLFRGNSDGSFTEVTDGYEFLTAKTSYTMSSWIDYDEDGDTDLFIASGPASGPSGIAPDFLYKNLQIENGSEGFQKLTNSDLSFANDGQDGQNYNIIDYDNDGDLDVCLTNYSGVENKFYVNNSGVYSQTATPFTANNDSNLSNSWADFDNDGDLDVITTASSGTGAGYFENNGDGTFTQLGMDFINSTTGGNSTGVSIGDYNNDGNLDFFVVGGGIKALFKNDNSNGNSYVNFELIGDPSNKAALGARVDLTATINGTAVTQKRQVSASNTFMGHNSLRVHFGLGNATVIDELVIHWPSGSIDTHTNLTVSEFYEVLEGNSPVILSTNDYELNSPEIDFFPNPSNSYVTIRFNTFSSDENNMVYIFDSTGKLIDSQQITFPETTIDVSNFKSGVYLFEISTEKIISTKKLIIN